MKYVSWLTPQITVHYLSSYPIEILPSEFGQSESGLKWTVRRSVSERSLKWMVARNWTVLKLNGLETGSLETGRS